MSQTRIVLTIDHPDDLDNITAESITETFDEAGDVDWKVSVESIVREKEQAPDLMAALKESLDERIEQRPGVIQ